MNTLLCTTKKLLASILCLFLLIIPFNSKLLILNAKRDSYNIVVQKKTPGERINKDFTFFIKVFGESLSYIYDVIDFEPPMDGMPFSCYFKEFQVPSDTTEITIQFGNDSFYWETSNYSLDVYINYNKTTKTAVAVGDGTYQLVLSDLSPYDSIYIDGYFFMQPKDSSSSNTFNVISAYYKEQTTYDLSNQNLASVGDGVYQFTVKSNDNVGKTIADIPADYQYEIWEAEEQGWTLASVDGEEKSKVVDTATSHKTHTFINQTKNYKVEYYYQVEGVYILDHSETRSGAIGSTVSVLDSDKQTNREYYVFNDSLSTNALSGVVDGDGLLTLKVYFKQQVPLTFVLDGGQYDNNADDIVKLYDYGANIIILDAPTREGYKFLYWKGSVYHPGDLYSVEKPHTFTAQWEKVQTTSSSKKTKTTSTDPVAVPKTSVKG